MGNFYYPTDEYETSWAYIFYASVDNDLRDAIELAEKLYTCYKYDEVYLIDPNINFHVHEVNMLRRDIPPYLKVIASERTSSRIPFSNNDSIKRVYLFFEKAEFISYQADVIILLSLREIAEGYFKGTIDASSIKSFPTLIAYR